MERLNVLSLFDGMSCGQQALERSGIKYNKYYASEIDKYAIQVTQHNYPDTIQLGSVTEVDVTKLDYINLLIGGSPCQSFSFAGKRNGMTTTCNEEIYTLGRYLELKSDGFQFEGESYLFWEYMRILTDIRKYNPDVLFLLENVEMGNKWERILSEAIGIFGVHINSALVSAQNRKRIYWTNIRVREEGLFGELHSDIPQPEDRGILLKDVLEDNVDEKYYLSERGLSGMLTHKDRHESSGNGFGVKFISKETEKSNTILHRYYKDCKDNAVCIYQNPRGYNNGGFHASKSPTVGASSWENNIFLVVPESTTKGYVEIEPGECFDFENINSKTMRRRKMTDKPNTLMESTTNLMRFDGLSERHLANLKNGDEKANSFLSSSWKGAQANGMTLVAEHPIGARIRRLTPVECERLQTVEDNYTAVVSDTQRYKALGNGWTIDVIAHIFSFINNGKT